MRIRLESFSCNRCNLPNFSNPSTRFEGAIIWARYKCTGCGEECEQPLDISHFRQSSLVRRKSTAGYDYEHDPEINWIVQPLLSGKKGKASFRIIKNRTLENFRLYNCLDACYGHAMLKLFQVYRYLNDDSTDIVVLIPQVLEWMLPVNIAAAVVVESPLSELNYPLEGFHEFCEQSFSDVEITIDELPLNFDYGTLDVRDFIGNIQVEKTDHPVVTFLWREDRFWVQTRVGEFIHLVWNKYRWAWLKSMLLHGQEKKFKALAAKLQKDFPTTEIQLIGLTTSRTRFSWAKDHRCERPGKTIEHDWCRVLCASDLVVGIHGSHMILPSLLAGAVIELLPSWKIDHWGEDILFLKSDLVRRTKLRILPQTVRRSVVVKHMVSILSVWRKWYYQP